MAIPENAIYTICLEHDYTETVLAYYGKFKTPELADKYIEYLRELDAGNIYLIRAVWTLPGDVGGILNDEEFFKVFYREHNLKKERRLFVHKILLKNKNIGGF